MAKDANSKVGVSADPEPSVGGRDRKPAIAAGLSFLWPGLGQLFLGRRREAAILAVPALLLAIVAVIQLSQGALMFVFSLWDETYFVAVAVAVIGFGLWRAVAVGHAFLSATGAPRSRPRQLAFASILIVAIVATHGLFIAGTWAWYSTSVEIQNNDPLGLGSPDPATPTPTLVPTPSDTATLPPDATPLPTATPTRGPNPNRITFLLIGVDWMPGRDHSVTDTMMLVSLDTSTNKASMVSVPRDTAGFDLYYGGKVDSSFKLNTLMNAAMSKTFRAPDKPEVTLEKEIGFLMGVKVDYYALIGLQGLAGMIDTMGGVDVYNSRAIVDGTNAIYIPAGNLHLNGETAIGFVRSREGAGDSDYTRAARQQAVLMAAKAKMLSATGISRLGSILSEAGRDISTDFPLNTARNYVSAVQRISTIESCVLGPPYSVHPDPSTSGGKWVTNLDMARVANLSVHLFGEDSTYYGQPGVTPASC